MREHDRYEEAIRKLYDDFSHGDLEAVLEACADDITFHVPGVNQLSGNYGKSEFVTLIGKVAQITNGTFREEVLDVMIGNAHAAVLLHHKLERDGETRGYLTLHLWEMAEGRLTNWWEYPRDLTVFDDVWK